MSKRKKKSGAILIIALWILTIVTLLALGISFRVGIEMRLSGVFVSQIKVLEIAKAAVMRAIGEAMNDLLESGEAEEEGSVFSYAKPWALDEDLFRDVSIGDGSFTVSFEAQSSEDSEEREVYFGLEDEQARININAVASIRPKNRAKKIIKTILGEDVDKDDKTIISGAIIDWLDKSEDEGGLSEVSGGGAEDSYYESLDSPYTARDGFFRTPEELMLVRGMTPEIFRQITSKITVYGNGQVNINTASREVLLAIGNLGESFVDRIIEFRLGDDRTLGTEDDGVFEEVSEIETSLGYVKGSIGALDELRRKHAASEEAKDIGIESIELLGTTSNVFRVNVFSKMDRNPMSKSITVVFERLESDEEQDRDKFQILHWNER